MSCELKLRGILSLLLGAAIASSAARAADDAEPNKPGQQPVPEAPDPFAVPDGNPQEMLAYIEELRGRQPAGTDAQAVAAFKDKVHRAIVEAADKAIAGKPTDQQLESALSWKVIALNSLEESGDAGAAGKLKKLLDDLKKSGKTEFVREIRGFLFERKLGAAVTAGPEQTKKLVAQIEQFIGEAPPGRAEVRLAIRVGRTLERVGNGELAADTYRRLAKVFAGSDNKAIVRISLKMEGIARRLTLLGKKMHLEGTFLDGKPLKWDEYRGKIVLVQFWATWCGPCRAEIVNVKSSYELYQDRGFEVIGVNCDNDRKMLEEYLENDPLPWKNLFSTDAAAAGMDNPMATYYGVLGIPTLILVGPDGNVVSLNTRGPMLGQHLEKLLGPAEEKGEEGGE